MKYVKGNTAEEKFDSIERVFQSWKRKLGRKVIVAIPPIPIFKSIGVTPDDGVLLSMLMPMRGTITDVAMAVESYNGREAVEFELSAIGLDGSASRTFRTRKELIVETLNLSINIGDRIMFKVLEPDRVSNIHIGAAFQVDPKDMKHEKLLELKNDD